MISTCGALLPDAMAACLADPASASSVTACGAVEPVNESSGHCTDTSSWMRSMRILDLVENPHAAHGGSEVFSSNCYR
jgi:hypothetical protein